MSCETYAARTSFTTSSRGNFSPSKNGTNLCCGRAGLFGAMEKAFFRHFYDDEEDALDRARQHQSTLDAARDRVFEETSSMVQEVLFDTTQNETEQ